MPRYASNGDCEWVFTNGHRTEVRATCVRWSRIIESLYLDDAEQFSYCPYCGQPLVLPSGDGSPEEEE